MLPRIPTCRRILPLLLAALLGLGTLAATRPADPLPWREAGLTEREAAAHLLDRFTFGPRPGDVDHVVAMGLNAWFESQLAARQPEPGLRRLSSVDVLTMSAQEIVRTFPNPGLVLMEAASSGKLDFDPRELAALQEGNDEGMDSGDRRQMLMAVRRWAQQQGYRSQRELLGILMANKLLRAVYAENQLAEVMTDFWFNHFNVSLTNNMARSLLLPYERDAIRPHVLGRFRDLLGATARHPAMLLYLDNARSTANAGQPTTFDRDRLGARFGRSGGRRSGRDEDRPGRSTGLNENYARELLELHTLGVDGGYTQQDVVEVARAFTGWAVLPPGQMQEQVEARLARARRFGGLGFVHEGLFLFRADVHDAAAKTVLGHRLPAGRGIEDGEEVLDLLAAHPATARHLAQKLAVRFVADEPPPALVERLAASFQRSGGQLQPVLRTLVRSPEFWQSRRQKVKSPFELATSALRVLGARIEWPREALEWVSRMGQPLYAYQAPTGYPDRGDFWVNTGSLLNRMNFGLQLAAGRVDGLRFDLAALDDHREPESLMAALTTYVPLLMPERDPEETLRLLEPVIHDPQLAAKIERALPEPRSAGKMSDEGLDRLLFADREMGGDPLFRDLAGGQRRGGWRPRSNRSYGSPSALEQVVGVILGSPEFQRR